VSLPESYKESLRSRLHEEARKALEEKKAKLRSKYEEYKGEIGRRYEEAVEEFASKLS